VSVLSFRRLVLSRPGLYFFHFWLSLSVLTVRGWGAHRVLHFEETVAVGSALSQGLFSSLNDSPYGTLVPRLLVEFAVLFPLEFLPRVLFGLATVLWSLFSLIIFVVVLRRLADLAAAWFASFVLVLVPLPELGMQGIVWNSFWPMFIALGAVFSVQAYGRSKSATWAVSVFALFTASSNPIALVLVVILLVDWLFVPSMRRRISVIFGGLLLGIVFSLVVQVRQEPALNYLGEWTQEFAQTSETLGRLEESGAATLRRAPDVDLPQIIRGLPGSVKFLLTQMMPEPFASRWILTETAAKNLAQTGLAFVFLILIPVVVTWRQMKRESSRLRTNPTLRLFLLAALSFAVQVALIGGVVQSRQYLFAPICFVWIGTALSFSKLLAEGRPGLKLEHVLAVVVTAIFLANVKQNFRDPLEIEPRQGGMGRYEDVDLWKPALDRARTGCQNMDVKSVIIVSQTDETWIDSPVVVQCQYITK